MMPAMMFIGSLTYVGIAVLGGLMVASGQLRLGDVQAFIQYSQQFTQPLSELGGMAAVVQSGTASAERVFELLDEEEQEPDAEDAPTVTEGGRHRVRARRVLLHPDKPLIRDLSFRVEPGQTVAIVGPTGAGKTTLVNLIMRFYELDGGRILLDGRTSPSSPATTCARAPAWCCRIRGCSPARSARTSATATRGLRRRDRRSRRRDPRRPLRALLPDGYDTVLDEDAANVSAGRSSSSRSRARSSPSRASSSSMRRRARSTPAPSCCCSTRWRRCAKDARRS
jgi:ATP-binding cassette subfamily B protein